MANGATKEKLFLGMVVVRLHNKCWWHHVKFVPYAGWLISRFLCECIKASILANKGIFFFWNYSFHTYYTEQDFLLWDPRWSLAN